MESCKQEIEITVPVDEVQHETEHVVASVQKRAQIPGFRPGKAPASLIRTRFKDAIRQDVLESILPKAFRKKADEEHWRVVGTPNVTEVHFHEGEPLRFKAEFEIAPEIELKEYRGVETPYVEPQVSAEEIEERLERVRNQKAEFVNEDPRPLADGDYAVVSLESTSGVEGEPVRNEELVLNLGDPETLPEFTENLRGLSPGEEKDFDVTYPQDYGQERLSGKTIRFHVTVKAVRRKELPELNDEFARDLGDYQNLDEFREAIRKVIYAEKEAAAQDQARQHIIEGLIDQHEFPVPEAFIDSHIESVVQRQLYELSGRGIDPRSLNLDWAAIREKQKPRAERAVKGSLILEKIAEAESIHPTQDEVDREVQRIARQEREPVAAVRMRLEKDGTLGRIANRIRTDKTLGFLFEHARKIASPAPASEPAE